VNDLRRAFTFLVALAAPWLALAGVAAADAFYTYGFSPRAVGMGNAFSATADDWSSSYYNPGGNAFQHQPSLGVGLVANFAELHPIGVERLSLDQSQALIFGVNLPLPIAAGPLKDRFTLGVAACMPAGRLLQMQVDAPSQPNLILLQNAHRTSAMYPSLGIRATDGLAFGVGVQTLFDTVGQLKAAVDPAGNLDTQVGEELLMRYALVAGVLFRPGAHWDVMQGWSFGAVFRDETYTHYHIPVSAQLNSIPFITTFDAISLFTPRQWVAAAAFHRGAWRFELDGSFNEWSRFPDPNLLVTVDVKIPVVPIHFLDGIHRPPHFHDTVTGRAGVEAEAFAQRDVEVLLRGGYSYDPSPVPPQRGYTNQVDADRHAGALSAGVKWLGVGPTLFRTPLTFDVMWQMQCLPRRVSYKDSSVDPSNPGYPKIGVEGFLQYIGGSVGVNFDYF
jgi:long-chain fatty acid transport protein